MSAAFGFGTSQRCTSVTLYFKLINHLLKRLKRFQGQAHTSLNYPLNEETHHGGKFCK